MIIPVEHLNEFDLINMNGRIYDPVLAMFLSPDNFIQAPGSTIGFNRYSYCFNNPLKYTDPSGNFAIWEFIIGNVLIYSMGYLNNILGFGMSPSVALRNTPIVFSTTGSFSFGEKSDYSAFYNYSSSTYSQYDIFEAQDYLASYYDNENDNSASSDYPSGDGVLQDNYLGIKGLTLTRFGYWNTDLSRKGALTGGGIEIKLSYTASDVNINYNWVQSKSINEGPFVPDNEYAGETTGSIFYYTQEQLPDQIKGNTISFYDTPFGEQDRKLELFLSLYNGNTNKVVFIIYYGYKTVNGICEPIYPQLIYP